MSSINPKNLCKDKKKMRTLREISKELKYLWFWGTGIEMSVGLRSSNLSILFLGLQLDFGCFFWNSGLMLDKVR